jgi:hypothetical protein
MLGVEEAHTLEYQHLNAQWDRWGGEHGYQYQTHVNAIKEW